GHSGPPAWPLPDCWCGLLRCRFLNLEAAMRRREFMTLVAGAAAWPLAAHAQKPTTVARIGVLASSPLLPLQGLFRKLRAYGYIQGQHVRFEPRFAEGRDE